MKHFCFVLSIIFVVCTKEVHGSEAGMPQLNTEFWAAQTFWLILIFSILYLIVWKVFLPKITYSIENRKSRVVNDLDEAEKLKENAEKKLKEYKEIIEVAKKDAKKIIEDARKKLDEEIEDKKKKFDEEIEKELTAVENEIKNLKKSSISNISLIAIETTSGLIKQTVNTEVNKSNVSAIVNEITKKRINKII